MTGGAADAASSSVLRVRYAETDRMNVAHHAEYLVWFEVGRTDWLRDRGLTYRDLEADGFLLPVVEVASRYHWPARYDDELDVRTELASANRVRLSFVYEVVRESDGRRLATGRTTHAVTSAEGRPRRLPPEVLDRLRTPETSP